MEVLGVSEHLPEQRASSCGASAINVSRRLLSSWMPLVMLSVCGEQNTFELQFCAANRPRPYEPIGALLTLTHINAVDSRFSEAAYATSPRRLRPSLAIFFAAL